MQCSPNCLLCEYPNTCILCELDYYKNPNNDCVPLPNRQSLVCSTISNCISCTQGSGSTLQCQSCFPGFMPSPLGDSCVAQVCTAPNCLLCFGSQNNNFCVYCEKGYFLNSYLICVEYLTTVALPSCDIYMCLYCSYDGYCDTCVPGWTAQNGTCVTTKYCTSSNCLSCTSPEYCVSCNNILILNVATNECGAGCGVQNCQTCNGTSCIACVFPYSLGQNSCDCGFGSYMSGSQCLAYTCTASNCTRCESNGVCLECNPTFHLSNGTCLCTSQ